MTARFNPVDGVYSPLPHVVISGSINAANKLARMKPGTSLNKFSYQPSRRLS